jgi:hypothetical protein
VAIALLLPANAVAIALLLPANAVAIVKTPKIN